MWLAIAGCAALRPVGGDAVFDVAAGPRRGGQLVTLEVAPGWHLNPDYPFAFDPGADAFVFDGERRGHVRAPATGGTLHASFCDAERCRIEAVAVPPLPR
jgi:hypothetical protein